MLSVSPSDSQSGKYVSMKVVLRGTYIYSIQPLQYQSKIIEMPSKFQMVIKESNVNKLNFIEQQVEGEKF